MASASRPSGLDVVALDLCHLKKMADKVNLHEVKDAREQGVLHFAAGKGHLELCRFLVEGRLDVNSMPSTAKGGSPARCAAAHGNESVLRYLLGRGGDPGMLDSEGTSLLHFAVMGGNCEVVRLVLSMGADVDPPNYRGAPLHVAAGKDRVQVVKILLEHGADAGADVNFVDPSGRSILMEATDNGLIDIVKFLLEAGADPNLVDKAMDKDPSDATLFSNRSLCWLRLREGDQALSDAHRCILMRPHWSKAWYRQGAALSFLKDYKGAVVAFEQAPKLDPRSDEIKKALREAIAGMEGAAASMEQGNP